MKHYRSATRLFLCIISVFFHLSGPVRPTLAGSTNENRLAAPPFYQSNVMEVVSAPSDANQVYALIRNQQDVFVFASSDSGASWEMASSPAFETFSFYSLHLQVNPADARHLYLIDKDFYDSGRLIQSTDAGQTWSEIPVPALIASTSFSVSADSTINLLAFAEGETCPEAIPFLSTAKFVFLRSTDGGEHWTSSTIGCHTYGDILQAVPGNPDEFYLYMENQTVKGRTAYVYQSLDSGQTWNCLRGCRENSWPVPSILAVDPADRAHLIAHFLQYINPYEAPYVFVSELCHSTDHGGNWSCYENAPLMKDIVIAEPYLFAIGYQKLYRSADNGVTWLTLPAFLPGIQQVTAVASQPGRLLAASESHGVFISTDWGSTWQWDHSNWETSSIFLPIAFE